MDATIRERVLQLNPWLAEPQEWAAEIARRLPATFVPRQVELSGVADTSKATLVVGPRQAGKSTLVWSTLQHRDPREVLFLLCEEERVRAWCASATGFLADLRDELPSVRTVFLDEAQHLDDAGLFVKGLVDARRGLRVVVTGSGAFHLEDRTRESLAGRAIRRRLLPFSVAELVAARNDDLPAVRRQRRREIADRQLVYGGYPAVWSSPRPIDELREIVESFVIRDASDRFAIQRPDALRILLRLAAGQVGQMINLSEWAAIAGIAASTAAEYLDLLEQSWVLRQVPPFAGGQRREITHARRVHFYDPGIRNSLLGAFDEDVARRQDRGVLLESLVFAELHKALPLDATVHYWRAKGGAEMDFVVVRGERVVAVEVKGRDPGRLTRSTRSFVEAYAPALVLVACGSLDAPREQVEGGSWVRTVAVDEVADHVVAAVAPPTAGDSAP